MSCALQMYPNRKVVLLIDDPPNPGTTEDRLRLAQALRLPRKIDSLLRPQAEKIQKLHMEFKSRLRVALELQFEARKLAEIHEDLGDWFQHQANSTPINDHTDALYVKKVLYPRAYIHRRKSSFFVGKTSF